MLQPQLYTLSKLLNENLFIIPDYQLSYSWKTKQIEKEVVQIIQKKGWSKKVVQEREEELCQWMIEKWN